MSALAIIAGGGTLPERLAAAHPDALVAELEGFGRGIAGAESFRLERLVPFLDSLCERGVTHVVFAGGLRRPRLDPALFDMRTAAMVPRIVTAMQAGDDATLREVIAIFEDWDLAVVGAADLLPDLVAEPGVLVGTPGPEAEADVTRAAQIVEALGAVDVGQGAVVARGQCLAVETVPGTDAMLAFVAAHRAHLPAGGVLWKAPKPGQELRIDMPAIGPSTVEGAHAAGLSGIAIAAGGVMILDRAATLARAEALGLWLWARA
ncbi:LpxI family protein [Phaeovulum vinaykumarii]|uniref:Phosphatidate cytidylyltransferase n=1 Tax=Phaeovulum vinaykumarii TaxID=407234 RepID=A0A1N7MUD2_9RHOB|nr:UDP-2,3-diacylglucosamine diphosphatase LpxI [Phaeovulum vinaykumarii]SIS89754.1 hypothetical protein SAMN05421795_11028 [Phaeovulum vinaykumarii]SOC17090.1 hypothetical protein SAMN05878426_11148 [Phaeovulum vinaykumarii]